MGLWQEIQAWVTNLGGFATGLAAIAGLIYGFLYGLLRFLAWLSGPKIRTTYSLSGDPEEGNVIIISNPTSTPLMIDHWELYWKKWGPWGAQQVEASPEDLEPFSVAAHGRQTLSFREADHFDWGASAAHKGKLYLKLNLTDRKSVRRIQVYDPKR